MEQSRAGASGVTRPHRGAADALLIPCHPPKRRVEDEGTGLLMVGACPPSAGDRGGGRGGRFARRSMKAQTE